MRNQLSNKIQRRKIRLYSDDVDIDDIMTNDPDEAVESAEELLQSKKSRLFRSPSSKIENKRAPRHSRFNRSQGCCN